MNRPGTWIKICGTTSLRDARLAVEAGANAVGFVLAPSPRRIEVKSAAEIVAAIGGEVETIGVFVNESPARIAEIVEQIGLSGVQLHGDEDPVTVADVRRALEQRKIIKGFRANELRGDPKFAVEDYARTSAGVDAILLDSGSGQVRGGTGVLFDWDQAAPVAAAIREKMPLIVAGGLNSGNVSRAISLFQPWGVDVVSGVESAPGIKDATKLRDFVAAVHQSA